LPHRAEGSALAVGGIQRFTTIDYPGAIAAVVFVQGCAWRCVYCHNSHLQERPKRRRPAAQPPQPSWSEVRAWLVSRQGLLDAVVFSGGEPTLDTGLPAALADVRALGFLTGLHTAGMAPRRLEAVLPLLDWVGLDIKAPLHDDGALHDAVTGVRGGAGSVRRSLAILRAHGGAFQLRTTVHPDWLTDAALQRLQQELRELGAPHSVVQPGAWPKGLQPLGRNPDPRVVDAAQTWSDVTGGA
jgi:pyruvate formate lyase activating enzyme